MPERGTIDKSSIHMIFPDLTGNMPAPIESDGGANDESFAEANMQLQTLVVQEDLGLSTPTTPALTESPSHGSTILDSDLSEDEYLLLLEERRKQQEIDNAPLLTPSKSASLRSVLLALKSSDSGSDSLLQLYFDDVADAISMSLSEEEDLCLEPVAVTGVVGDEEKPLPPIPLLRSPSSKVLQSLRWELKFGGSLVKEKPIFGLTRDNSSFWAC